MILNWLMNIMNIWKTSRDLTQELEKISRNSVNFSNKAQKKIYWSDLDIKTSPKNNNSNEKITTPKDSAKISSEKDRFSSEKKELKKKLNIQSPSFTSTLKTDKFPLDAIENLFVFYEFNSKIKIIN